MMLPHYFAIRRKSLAFSSLVLIAALCLSGPRTYAQLAEQTLNPFDKIVVSPLVSMVLTKGERESVRLEYENIQPDQVNCVVKGKTLRIYLDDAKFNVKQRKWKENGRTHREPVYRGVKVTAYVTYRELKALQVRGEESVTCTGPLTSKKFNLRMYGESTVTLAALETDFLKAALFGENSLIIQSGKVHTQRFRLFGENTIDTGQLKCKNISTSIFGESKLNIFASNRLRVTTFGQSEILYAGNARLNRRLVLGEANISRVQIK